MQVLSEFLQVEAFAKFSNAIGKVTLFFYSCSNCIAVFSLAMETQTAELWCFWQVIEAQPDMPVVGAVTLYVSLLTFTLRVHPDRLDYVDQVLVSLL